MKKRIYICFIKTLLIFIYLFMKTKNSIQDVKNYLRKNTISETFLYNNRLFLNHYIKADEYEKNRMFILKYRSIKLNKNF